MTKKPRYRLSRREFVNSVLVFLGSLMGGVIGLPVIGYVISPALKRQRSDEWVSLGPLESYPLDEPTPFTFTRTKVYGWERTTNSYVVYVLRRVGEQVIAMSNVCTHLGCRVKWREDLQQFACPCHDGFFDIEGNVISGPPPRPLDRYETKIEDGILFIHFVGG
ncbi:MAG TPA: Rieske 2Fe-2S domain-containing protein [Caldilineae bacterium]|jgi:Rieske Fe-S protein|nr:Rieske 2Fe-2S domain-containing protein [Caldilineae bacterium]